jgi:membrane-bound lytic murein transglycosylase D
LKEPITFYTLWVAIACFICVSNAMGQSPKQDEIYAQRLATLKSSVEFTYNAEVKKYIDHYLENPDKIKELLGVSKRYFPLIEKALKVKNLPIELKYLAVAVSELNPLAENTFGASGQWMMMYTVSKMYKLKVNSFIDERKDVVKASTAAASHFKDLYSIYKQWPLAIAAYGCSPVMLNKCIRMANNSLYFWDVYPHIPESSRGLFPKVIATAYIFNFYKEHGIKIPIAEAPIETDSVLVNKWLSLQQISATIDIPLEKLRELNPIFKKDIIPYNPDGYWIFLPKNKLTLFELLKDSVYNPLPKQQEFAPIAIQKSADDTAAVQPITQEKAEPRVKKAKVYYTVKRGDNLGAIADWFDVSQEEVRKWNKIKGNNIAAGKKLHLFVNANKTGYYKRINNMNATQKKKLRNKD